MARLQALAIGPIFTQAMTGRFISAVPTAGITKTIPASGNVRRRIRLRAKVSNNNASRVYLVKAGKASSRAAVRFRAFREPPLPCSDPRPCRAARLQEEAGAAAKRKAVTAL